MLWSACAQQLPVWLLVDANKVALLPKYSRCIQRYHFTLKVVAGLEKQPLSCSLNIDNSLDWHVEDTKNVTKFPFVYASAIHFQIFLV